MILTFFFCLSHSDELGNGENDDVDDDDDDDDAMNPFPHLISHQPLFRTRMTGDIIITR